jgi:hypothetical protein
VGSLGDTLVPASVVWIPPLADRDVPIGAKSEVMTMSISIAMAESRKDAVRCVDGGSTVYQKAIGQ